MAEMASPIEGGIQAARGAAGGIDAALYTRVQAVESSISSLSGSLTGISQQMSQFSISLQTISANITAETNLERQKERQEQQQEFLLAQQQIREGKESAIERKIQSSLSTPVQKISAKAENTLGRLRNVFTGVLFGWLALSTVNLIGKYGKEVPKKFASVRDTILTNLNKAGQFLGTIRSSLSNVFSTISSISSRVAQHVNTGWFSEPINSLIQAVKGAFKKFFNIGSGSNNEGKGGSSELTSPPSSGSSGSTDTSNLTSEGESQATESQSTSTAGLSSLSNMLMSQGALENLGATNQSEEESKTSKPTTPKVNPLQINQEPVSSSKEEVHSEQQESQPAMYGNISISPLENVEGLDMSSSPVQTQKEPTSVAQISPVSKQDVAQKVGALPEPTPNVVVASAPAQQPQQQEYPQGKAPSFEVPTLLTSNPNNFYAMYSKTVYNVVT